MTSVQFCFWLQGFFEIGGTAHQPQTPSLAAEQVQVIKKHLALVFKHEIDPSQGSPEHQATLQEIHDAFKPSKPPRPPKRPGDTTLYRC